MCDTPVGIDETTDALWPTVPSLIPESWCWVQSFLDCWTGSHLPRRKRTEIRTTSTSPITASWND